MRKKNWDFKVEMSFWALFLLLGFSLIGSAEAAERKTFKLRVAAGHPYSEGTFWVRSLEDFFCRGVEKQVLEKTKDYKVELKGFYGGTLAKLGEVLEAIENGTADMGLITTVFEMAKLEPINFTLWVPFTTTDIGKILKVHTRTVDHFPAFDKMFERYNQRRVGAAYWPQSSYELITKFPVKTMEDLKGKKLGHGGPMLPWLSALGATSVQATYNDVFNAMQTGVIDGYCMPSNVVTAFKIYEVGKYFTSVNFGSTVVGVVTINLNSWKKLPKEVQDILVEMGNQLSWDIHKRCVAEEQKAWGIMEKAGVKILNLSQDERARWAKRLNEARVAAKAIADCQSHGFPAEEIASFYVKTLIEEGYQFPYPPTLK